MSLMLNNIAFLFYFFVFNNLILIISDHAKSLNVWAPVLSLKLSKTICLNVTVFQ